MLTNTICRARIWHGVIYLSCALLTSCVYGPPRIHTNIENIRAQPDSHIIAVSVKYQQLQDPTGINTFPNGSVSRILSEKANIYLCDVDTLEIKRVASILPPASMKSSWQSWVLGWANGNLFFSLTGRAGTKLKDFQSLNTVIYQVGIKGKLSEVKEIPDNIAFQHNTGPLLQGIFVRVSKGRNVINVRTEELKGWQAMFKTGDANGELVIVKELNK